MNMALSSTTKKVKDRIQQMIWQQFTFCERVTCLSDKGILYSL